METHMNNIIPCSICGQDTSFERYDAILPEEGEHVTCCDTWVCVDCFCWVKSDEAHSFCKDCCGCFVSSDNMHWAVGGK